MPLTPFHSGPTLLFGYLLRRRMDLVTFLVASVILDAFTSHDLAHGEPVAVGNLEITPVPVAHYRPESDTLAFRLERETEAMATEAGYELSEDFASYAIRTGLRGNGY